MQNQSPTIGLPFLMHEASIPGACLEAGAADIVVLVGEEGDVSEFQSVEVGLVVVDSFSARLPIAFVLHGARERLIRANGLSKICSKPCTHSLDRLVVHVSDLLGSALILTVLLLLLFLPQEIFLQS